MRRSGSSRNSNSKRSAAAFELTDDDTSSDNDVVLLQRRSQHQPQHQHDTEAEPEAETAPAPARVADVQGRRGNFQTMCMTDKRRKRIAANAKERAAMGLPNAIETSQMQPQKLQRGDSCASLGLQDVFADEAEGVPDLTRGRHGNRNRNITANRTQDVENSNSQLNHDHSESFNSDDHSHSEGSQETAIRKALLEVAVDYFKNAMFGQLLGWLAGVLKPLWTCLKRLAGQDDNKEEALHNAEEALQDLGKDFMGDFANSGAESFHNTSFMYNSTTTLGGAPPPGMPGTPGVVPPAGVPTAPVPMPVGPPPGVAEMATAAANSAASGASSGAAAAGAASSAAAGAAGGAGAASSTMASAVAGASSVAQTAVAVGVATTVATVTAGIVVAAPKPQIVYTSDFVPPDCSQDAQMKMGYVQLAIQGLPPHIIPSRKFVMEELFRDIYNEITGMCLDPMHRVLHEAILETWETDWGEYAFLMEDYNNTHHYFNENQNMTQQQIDEYEQAVAASITTTFWEGRLACSGCPDHEPLFAAQNQLPSSTQRTRRRRLIQIDLRDFFPIFVATFGYNLNFVMDGNGTVAIDPKFSGFTDDPAGGIQIVSGRTVDGESTVVMEIGNATIEHATVFVNNTDSITAAFSPDLQQLKDCVDESRTSATEEQSDFCRGVSVVTEDLDEETLNKCLDDPTSLECQELLPNAIEESKEVAFEEQLLPVNPSNSDDSNRQSDSTASTEASTGSGGSIFFGNQADPATSPDTPGQAPSSAGQAGGAGASQGTGSTSGTVTTTSDASGQSTSQGASVQASPATGQLPCCTTVTPQPERLVVGEVVCLDNVCCLVCASPSPTVTPGSPSASPTTEVPTTTAPTVTPGSPSASPTTRYPAQLESMADTDSPTVTPGSPSAAPTTGAPTTPIRTTGFPTVTPGSPSSSPTTESPAPLTPTTTMTPTTMVPTVTPGSPSSSPTTERPASLAPTTSRPTVTPGNPSALPTTLGPGAIGLPTVLPGSPSSSLSTTASPMTPMVQPPTVTSNTGPGSSNSTDVEPSDAPVVPVAATTDPPSTTRPGSANSNSTAAGSSITRPVSQPSQPANSNFNSANTPTTVGPATMPTLATTKVPGSTPAGGGSTSSGGGGSANPSTFNPSTPEAGNSRPPGGSAVPMQSDDGPNSGASSAAPATDPEVGTSTSPPAPSAGSTTPGEAPAATSPVPTAPSPLEDYSGSTLAPSTTQETSTRSPQTTSRPSSNYPISPVPTTSPSTWAPTSTAVEPAPSLAPTSAVPTQLPTTLKPTSFPTALLTTFAPTDLPTIAPTSFSPVTGTPTLAPTPDPTSLAPTPKPTNHPTPLPTPLPTMKPTTGSPTRRPTNHPTSKTPTALPTRRPTNNPTSNLPTSMPTRRPTNQPTTRMPTNSPSSTSAAPTSLKPTTSPPTSCPSALTTSTMPVSSPVPTSLAPTLESPAVSAPPVTLYNDWTVRNANLSGQTLRFDTGTAPGAPTANVKVKVKDFCRAESSTSSDVGYFYPISSVDGIHSDTTGMQNAPGPGNTLSFRFVEGINTNVAIYSEDGEMATISFCLEVGLYAGDMLVNFAEVKATFQVDLTNDDINVRK